MLALVNNGFFLVFESAYNFPTNFKSYYKKSYKIFKIWQIILVSRCATAKGNSDKL